MATPEAISAQGTILEIQVLGAGPFFEIGELRDNKPPGRTRKEIETTNHNSLVDSYVSGILRRTTMTATLGYVPGGGVATNHAKLDAAIDNKTLDIYRVTFPNTHGILFSGFLVNLSPSAPVDDGLVTDVSIRPTGDHTIF
jgi:hypothetical protein